MGCSDVAGIVQAVIDTSGVLRAEHLELQGTVHELEKDQRRVAEASDEARLLSASAIERLGQGTSQIQSSLSQITRLLDMVETLATHVTGFAAAMDQVKRCSKDIAQIAETTNILALNATVDGMTTAHYIADQLGERVRITSLAQGVPIGGELDYLDDGTISAAMRARKAL